MKIINAFLFFLLISIVSCSPEESSDSNNQIIKITSNPPATVRIGEIVTFSGENLHEITAFKVGNEFGRILNQSKNEIQVKIPTVYDDVFYLKAMKGLITVETISLKLVGTYPLKTNINFLDDEIIRVQVSNENKVFCTASNKLYRSNNGGVNWDLIYSANTFISSMFFLNEDIGWIGTGDGNLLKTMDGGNSYNIIYSPSLTDNQKPFVDIIFTSENTGYLLSSYGDIYTTDNGSQFQLEYDFPHNTNDGVINFKKLELKNDIIIAHSNHVLIIKKPGSVEYEFFNYDKDIFDVQIVGEKQIYMTTYVDNILKLIRSNDFGLNWEVTGDQKIEKFYFIDQNIGIALTRGDRGDFHIIYETRDGGESWINKFNFKDYEYGIDIDFYGNIGFISGYRGHFWKHIID